MNGTRTRELSIRNFLLNKPDEVLCLEIANPIIANDPRAPATENRQNL